MTVLGIFHIDIQYSGLGTMVLWEILEHDLAVNMERIILQCCQHSSYGQFNQHVQLV